MDVNVYIDGRRPRSDGEMPVKLTVRRYGEVLMLNTGLRTKRKFEGTIFPQTEPSAKAKTATLTRYYQELSDYVYRNPNTSLEHLKRYTQIEIFGKRPDDGRKKKKVGGPMSLADNCEHYGDGMKKSTARLYKLTAERIREYDMLARADSIDKVWLMGFETFLREKKGLSVNGVAQKMRCIRATMNLLRSRNVTSNYPFSGREGYRIKEEEGAVNSLTPQEFANLRDYPCEPWQKIYVDMFCLSTYLAGINAGDLLMCRGLTNGRLVFTRRKTDKCNATKIHKISLPVYPEAMEIIERYKGKNYLLSIMDNMTDYKTFVQHWNKALKKIGPVSRALDKGGKHRGTQYAPILPDITTYSARYTFASVACNDLDISERTVGMCLGHAWSREVTSRYISNDQSKIDRAIRSVIDELNAHKGEYGI